MFPQPGVPAYGFAAAKTGAPDAINNTPVINRTNFILFLPLFPRPVTGSMSTVYDTAGFFFVPEDIIWRAWQELILTSIGEGISVARRTMNWSAADDSHERQVHPSNISASPDPGRRSLRSAWSGDCAGRFYATGPASRSDDI
jgi:hypothetical protein